MFGKMITILGLTFCLGIIALADGGGESDTSSQSSEYQTAVKAIEIEDYTKAVGLLQTVIDNNPKNANAWNYMGYSLRHLRKYDEALAAYEKALQIKPKHKGALEYLGELFLETGQLEKAKIQLKNLDKACFFSCKEYRELKEKIENYKAG